MKFKITELSNISRRGLIRLTTITASLVIVLAVFSGIQYNLARRYSQRIQYDYEQQLDSLGVYLSNIDNGLKISAYISTPEQFAKLSSSVWQNCGSAKACISALPTAVAEFDNTYRFLSQAGEYMKSISVSFSDTNSISDTERQTLKKYSSYASKLCTQISNLRDEMDTNGLWDDMAYNVTFTDPDEIEQEFFYSSLKETESGLKDIPDPIYNGPFSNHITSKESELLKTYKEIELSKAKEIAAKILSVSTDRLTFTGESSDNDNFPSYRFESGLEQYIAITKRGGLVAYFLKESYAEKTALTEKQALEKCREYIENMGYQHFKATHYSVSDAVMTAEFCYTENDVTILTDVIKISIEMDSGNVFAYDARQYLLNYKHRNIEQPKFSKEQALHRISSSLTMQSVSTVIIPSDNVTDTLCYQFICRADDNTKVLVYINCNTLIEEKIILIDEQSTGVYL